jgi:hypothetical protein
MGRRFVEACALYGEAPARSIRGQAVRASCAGDAEEGIEVMALPLLPGSAETLQ